jgi:hypothetical protein
VRAPGGGAATEGVWLEVALNGAWTRRRRPAMPVTRAQIVEEAVACADAGAAIVHVHAYDEDSGDPREAHEIHAPVVEDIRRRTDVICCPTVHEPGFLRAGAVLHDAVPGAPRPVHRFMLSTGSTFGLPPTERALDTCLRTAPGSTRPTART